MKRTARGDWSFRSRLRLTGPCPPRPSWAERRTRAAGEVFGSLRLSQAGAWRGTVPGLRPVLLGVTSVFCSSLYRSRLRPARDQGSQKPGRCLVNERLCQMAASKAHFAIRDLPVCNVVYFICNLETPNKQKA